MASGYGLSEREIVCWHMGCFDIPAHGYGIPATAMERAGQNIGKFVMPSFADHALGGRYDKYYSAKSFRAQLADLANSK